MTVRTATAQDLPALLAVQSACSEAPQWTVEQWRAVLALPAKSSFSRAVFIAEHDGELVGFIVVRCVAGVAEIDSLAVLPEHRRKGLARALCEAAMRSGDALIEEVQLEVRASNAAAIALYRSLGFSEQGRRRGYYDHPKEDAVLMARRMGKTAAQQS